MAGMTDLELEGVTRGTGAADAVGRLQDARAGTRGGGTLGQAIAQTVKGPSIPWEMLQQRHSEWCASYWAECRALYAGGKRLLEDPSLLARLFPKNPFEPPTIYMQRVLRAHYFPYPGTIVDSLLAGLGSDPLRISFGKIDEKTGTLDPVENAEWWADFVEDVSDEADTDDRPEPDEDDDDNAAGLPMHHFLIEVLRECEQTRFTWVRVDLPKAPDMGAITSQLDVERSKATSPYLCLVPAENVIDWEYDDRGELLWALTLEKTTPRSSIMVKRGALEHHVYMLWTQTDWVRYEVDVNPKQLPPLEQPVPATDFGQHAFGCVPFDRVMLPEGLWAMGKLHSLAREHFNKRCAMSWAEYKALFSILYEFLDDGAPGTDLPVVDSPDRATDQVRAQGFTQLRRKGDDARFVGPDVAPFKESRESCSDTMREMHRVMFSMALSANMDKAALSRSGDSKEQDSLSTQVVLSALGQLMRRVARVLLALVGRGRGERVPPAIVAGLEHFDVSGVASAIADGVSVFSSIPINKSKTAYSLYLGNLLRKILGDTLTDEQVATIRREIDDSMSAEELLIQQLPGGMTPATEDDGDDEDDADDGDDGDDGSDDPPKPPKGGPIRSKPMKK